jgi:hypothetical protein
MEYTRCKAYRGKERGGEMRGEERRREEKRGKVLWDFVRELHYFHAIVVHSQEVWLDVHAVRVKPVIPLRGKRKS